MTTASAPRKRQQKEEKQVTAAEIMTALRSRHRNWRQGWEEWAFFEELRGVGYGGVNEKRIDAWAIRLWAEKVRIAYEIKVSRSDFLREIKDPEKRQHALSVSNLYYFAAPSGLIKPDELPQECGLIEVATDKNGTGLRSWIKVRAPHRDTAAPSWSFVAAIARRAKRLEVEAKS